MIPLIDTNFRLHATKIVGQTEGMQVMQTENLVYADSSLSCDTFNIIHITRGTHITRPELSEALQYYRSRHLDYCLWVNAENRTPQLQTYLQELSVFQQNEELGMALNLEGYQPRHKDTHKNIIQVTNLETLTDYARVIAANWNPPDQHVLDYYRMTASHYLNTKNQMMLLIYYHEGKAVSTVELFPSDDRTVGLYGLATLEAYRGKGIGSSLMTMALNKAKQSGYQWAILQASEDGVNIYRKLGFKDYTTYYEYA